MTDNEKVPFVLTRCLTCGWQQLGPTAVVDLAWDEHLKSERHTEADRPQPGVATFNVEIARRADGVDVDYKVTDDEGSVIPISARSLWRSVDVGNVRPT